MAMPKKGIAESPRLTMIRRSMPIEIWPTSTAAAIISRAKNTRL